VFFIILLAVAKGLWRERTDYLGRLQTNIQITKELKITPILDKLLEHNNN
jgi:hypothetical protein